MACKTYAKEHTLGNTFLVDFRQFIKLSKR
jgi:hypothetical protein